MHAAQHESGNADPIHFDAIEQIELTAPAQGDVLQMTGWMEASGQTETLYKSTLLTISGTGNPAAAFDGNLGNQWLSSGTHNLFISFPETNVITKFVITANAGDWIWADYPIDWILYGSHSGAFAGEEVTIASGSAV